MSEKIDLNKFKSGNQGITTQGEFSDDLGSDAQLKQAEITPENSDDEYIGLMVVPRDWEQQKTRYKHAGMEEQWNNRDVLTISEAHTATLGKGYKDILLVYFEGQPKRLHFFANRFVVVGHVDDIKQQ